MSEQHSDELRRRAEEQLAANDSQIQSLERADLASLAHELAVHQIELEIQNEELLRTRTRAEEALRESEERFRRAINATEEGLWEWVIPTDQEFFSPRWCEIIGYSSDDPELPHTYKSWVERIHPDDSERVIRALKNHLEKGTKYDVDYRHRHKSGEYRWQNSRGQVIYDESGKPTKMVGVISDITARKQAEEALRQSTEQLAWELAATQRLQEIGVQLIRENDISTLYDRILDTAMAIMRSDFASIQIRHPEGGHRGELRLLGQRGFDPRAARFWEWVGPASESTCAVALRTGQRVIAPDVRTCAFMAGSDDQKTYLETGIHAVQSTPLVSRSGRVVGMISTHWRQPHQPSERDLRVLDLLARQAADLFEYAKAGETLRELNTTLESKVAERTAQSQHRARQLAKLTLEVSQTEDRERKRMAEILHDDLQQIIAAAKFHLSLLSNRVKYDASLQAIAARIDQMLKDAIEKSRSLSHELSPTILHHGDFTETLGWLANQMRAKHGLVVHVHASGQARVQSDAVRTFLYKTAQEFLFNVVKHARVHEAGIRVRRYGPYICLSVSDRGGGFDPQELGEAAGFGLLGIRERIELLGGRMKIKSAKGKGSTFFVVVPDGEQVVAPPLSGVTATQPGASGSQTRSSAFGVPAGPRAQNRLRVLLADDHRIVREGLRSLLSDEPDVEIAGEAAHGREAVDLALRLEPDVVIMDVSMPLIDGDVATRQIKEHLPKTRVIALSTYNEPEKMERMYRAGAENYVLKTASSEELLAAIRGQVPDS